MKQTNKVVLAISTPTACARVSLLSGVSLLSAPHVSGVPVAPHCGLHVHFPGTNYEAPVRVGLPPREAFPASVK